MIPLAHMHSIILLLNLVYTVSASPQVHLGKTTIFGRTINPANVEFFGGIALTIILPLHC